MQAYDPKYVYSDFGLNNNGSICWFNTMLQVLFSCPSLNKAVLENKEAMLQPANRLAVCYYEAVAKMHKEKESFTNADDEGIIETRKGMISPVLSHMINIEFNRQLIAVKKGSDLVTPGQKDVDEGILLFIDLLDKPFITNLFSHRYVSGSYCLGCRDVSYYNNNEPTNLIVDITMFSKISDDSGNNGTDKNNSFRKTIARMDSAAADEFSKKISLHASKTDNYKCEKCSKTSAATLVFYHLAMTQPILMIRFRNTNTGKGKENVSYSEFLRFQTKSGTTLVYKLISVAHHSGSQQQVANNRFSSGGHYYATCWRSSYKKKGTDNENNEVSDILYHGEYRVYNDNNVSTVVPFSSSTNAYIVVYHLIFEEADDLSDNMKKLHM